jgi:hypothetical protein
LKNRRPRFAALFRTEQLTAAEFKYCILSNILKMKNYIGEIRCWQVGSYELGGYFASLRPHAGARASELRRSSLQFVAAMDQDSI